MYLKVIILLCGEFPKTVIKSIDHRRQASFVVQPAACQTQGPSNFRGARNNRLPMSRRTHWYWPTLSKRIVMPTPGLSLIVTMRVATAAVTATTQPTSPWSNSSGLLPIGMGKRLLFPHSHTRRACLLRGLRLRIVRNSTNYKDMRAHHMCAHILKVWEG